MAALAQNRTAEELMASLGSLTAKETKTLLAQLALRAKPANVRGERDVETWASCVADAMSAAMGTSAAAALVRKEMSAAATWAPIKQFLDDAGFIDLKVAEKQAVYSLLARLLVQYANRVADYKGLRLSPHFVASCAAHIGDVFDEAFPGYLASGLAHIIVRRLCAKSA